MLTFYFFASLILFQFLYGIALSGVVFSDHSCINRMGAWALHSGWGQPTRMLLLSLSLLLSLDAVKAMMEKCWEKRAEDIFFFCAWVAAASGFVCFDKWFLGGGFQLLIFALLFLISFAPFLNNQSHQPGVSDRIQSLKSPSKLDKSSPFSIALPTKKGLLPINSPQRGICIMGNAGSGKTMSLLEPILYALIKKGYCGLVYDYKFKPVATEGSDSYSLSKFVFNCYRNLDAKTRGRMRFRLINFTDPSRSVRVNPIHPNYIQKRTRLGEYISILFSNLKKEGEKTGDSFWTNSAEALFKSIIIFLANNAPNLCTIPHAMTMLFSPFERLMKVIEQDEEATEHAHSIFEACKAGENATGQFQGIIGNLKISLSKLLSKEVFWVLTSHEIPFQINDKENPLLLCMGNSVHDEVAFSPVLAVLIMSVSKHMQEDGRRKSFLAIDELPTVRLPNLAKIPATSREYGIATVVAIQEKNQLNNMYTTGKADEIMGNLASQFVGNSKCVSAKYGAELLGKREYLVSGTSTSTSSKGVGDGDNKTKGQNQSIQEKYIMRADEFGDLEVGCFAGKVVGSNRAGFQEHFKPVKTYDKKYVNKEMKELPIFKKVTEEELDNNRHQIRADIKLLLGFKLQKNG